MKKKNHEKKKWNQKSFGALLFLFLAAAITLGAVLVITKQSEVTKTALPVGVESVSARETLKVIVPPSPSPMPQQRSEVPPVPLLYSGEEMQEFWKLHAKPTAEQLIFGTYSISGMNERYAAMRQKAIKKYGVAFSIQPFPKYNNYSRFAVVASVLINGVPVIGFYVPSLMDRYNDLKRHLPGSVGKKQFEVIVVVAILHEADHFVGEWSGPHSSDAKQELLNGEVNAWGDTTEHTISKFVDSGYVLDGDSKTFYEGWISCGRNKNECWKSFVENIYSQVAQYRQ